MVVGRRLLIIGLLFSGASSPLSAMCTQAPPQLVELHVQDCGLSHWGSTVITGHARLIEAADENGSGDADTRSPADAVPVEEFQWHYDSPMQCDSVEVGSSMVVFRYDKCCDVFITDADTGEVRAACDDEPWVISAGG